MASRAAKGLIIVIGMYVTRSVVITVDVVEDIVERVAMHEVPVVELLLMGGGVVHGLVDYMYI